MITPRPSYHLLGILVFASLTLGSVVTWVLSVLIFIKQMMTNSWRIKRHLILLIFPLVAMIGFGSVFAVQNETYDAAKDLWYVLKVITLFCVGFVLFDNLKNPSEVVRILAIYIVGALIIETVEYWIVTITYGPERFIPGLVFAPVLIFYLCEQASLRSRRNGGLTLLALIFLSIVLIYSESRTILGALVISILGCFGWYRSAFKILGVLILFFGLVLALSNLLPAYDSAQITFVGKLQNSLNEVAFVDDDYDTVTHSWRGFEMLKAFETWQLGTLSEKVFGQGLGAKTDIGIFYQLSESYNVRYLPVLHNAFFMVGVKYGIMGVASFLLFLALPFFQLRRLRVGRSPVINLALSGSLILIFSSQVITGPLNIEKLDGVTLLFGWCLAAISSLTVMGRKDGLH